MKVTDLKENECIHCKTEEQANAICKLMYDAGLRWHDGDSYLSVNLYNIYKSEICYFPAEGTVTDLDYAKDKNYTIYKSEQFLNQETKTMNTVLNINQDTSEINITPKEGFEIDLENSDLKNGKVLFKEVKSNYPSEFEYYIERDGLLSSSAVSEKYAEKLNTLDTLLCLRDEYNRIDGFTEVKYCIENFEGKLLSDLSYSSNKIMHFGKEETAELFLKNFEEQLETVKEFL